MLAEVIKELHADSVKFDQASYDAARKGIAQLIISEASEIADTDSDERDDIDTLLSALKHLFNFRDGELDEDNEAALSTDGSLLNLSADATSKDCDCDGCAACQADGGCDDKICKGCTKMSAKSADISKCLECGCHQVDNAHGKTQVVVTGATPTMKSLMFQQRQSSPQTLSVEVLSLPKVKPMLQSMKRKSKPPKNSLKRRRQKPQRFLMRSQ